MWMLCAATQLGLVWCFVVLGCAQELLLRCAHSLASTNSVKCRFYDQHCYAKMFHLSGKLLAPAPAPLSKNVEFPRLVKPRHPAARETRSLLAEFTEMPHSKRGLQSRKTPGDCYVFDDI
ncbi:lethal(2) giant larvae homolog, putative [Babesia ovata]|uniref:Lethal(2) giant larvae homolog, putative n=1 Tax=Babesia ovata TaxID=189622 RepID=A0A2H6KEL8_9APIC|nr:lethal(2) giant larvae homolog, putative [Babesia ovata]GBE61441.1 lethal(2) giant larvae homolog, putative [Babesia ovata]